MAQVCLMKPCLNFFDLAPEILKCIYEYDNTYKKHFDFHVKDEIWRAAWFRYLDKQFTLMEWIVIIGVFICVLRYLYQSLAT